LTSTGVALRAATVGVCLATAALLLVFAQLFLGLLLREPSLRHRARVRCRHRWVMIGLVTFALAHVAVNGPLVGRFLNRPAQRAGGTST